MRAQWFDYIERHCAPLTFNAVIRQPVEFERRENLDLLFTELEAVPK
jgi:hypothetical protein